MTTEWKSGSQEKLTQNVVNCQFFKRIWKLNIIIYLWNKLKIVYIEISCIPPPPNPFYVHNQTIITEQVNKNLPTTKSPHLLSPVHHYYLQKLPQRILSITDQQFKYELPCIQSKQPSKMFNHRYITIIENLREYFLLQKMIPILIGMHTNWTTLQNICHNCFVGVSYKLEIYFETICWKKTQTLIDKIKTYIL